MIMNLRKITNWGFNGVEFRQTSGTINFHARFASVESHVARELSLLQIFLLLFPTKYIQKTVIPQMNARLQDSTTYGEIIKFIGLFMACFAGFK